MDAGPELDILVPAKKKCGGRKEYISSFGALASPEMKKEQTRYR